MNAPLEKIIIFASVGVMSAKLVTTGKHRLSLTHFQPMFHFYTP